MAVRAAPRVARACARDAVAWMGESGGRGLQQAPAARSGRDGPRLRRGARCPYRGRRRARLRGAFQPQLSGGLRRDAAPLPPASARLALDVPPARDRAERHRCLFRRRLCEPWDIQPHLPRHRRRKPLGLPRRTRADRGAELLPDDGDAAADVRAAAAKPRRTGKARRSRPFIDAHPRSAYPALAPATVGGVEVGQGVRE